MWDIRVCQMWGFFHFGGYNKTLHSGSCCVPARHWEIYIFFSPSVVWRLWKSAACLLLMFSVSGTAFICFSDRFKLHFFLLVFSIITTRPYLIFSLLSKRSLSMFDWAEASYTLFLPPSIFLYLPFSRASSPPPARPPPPPIPPWGATVAANLSLQPVPPHRRGILSVQGKGNVSLPALSTLQSVNRACHQPLCRPLWRTISVPSCDTLATTSCNK